MDRVVFKGYVAEKMPVTGKNLNKWVMRIGIEGDVDRSLFQWDLNYKAKGEAPRQLKSKRDGATIPMDIIKECFLILFEGKKVTEDNKKVETSGGKRDIQSTQTTRYDVLMAIVNNSNGDKDVLMKVLSLLEDEKVSETNDVECETKEVESCTSDLESDNNDTTEEASATAFEPIYLECIEEVEPIIPPRTRKVRSAR